MLRIADGVPQGTVTYHETDRARRKREREQKRASSLAAAKAGFGPLRTLPWPQFLQKLENRREALVRSHVRWCMRSAIRSCESLKRAQGRCFELRPGGRGNLVVSGGFYHGHENPGHKGEGIRLAGEAEHIMLESSRYLNELDDNLRKLLCPPWAIPVVKRAIRAKLALGWSLDEGVD